MKKLMLVLLSLTIVGCGSGSGGSGGGDADSKNLFSVWTSGDSVIDLSTFDFGVFNIRIRYAPNAGCDCRMELDGDQVSGTARLFSCDQYGPVNYCSPGQTIYDYTNTNNQLNLCVGSDCEVYQ